MLITIGRQYGAGGREVAEILAKDIQIPLYDRKLVALTFKHYNIEIIIIIWIIYEFKQFHLHLTHNIRITSLFTSMLTKII